MNHARSRHFPFSLPLAGFVSEEWIPDSNNRDRKLEWGREVAGGQSDSNQMEQRDLGILLDWEGFRCIIYAALLQIQLTPCRKNLNATDVTLNGKDQIEQRYLVWKWNAEEVEVLKPSFYESTKDLAQVGLFWKKINDNVCLFLNSNTWEGTSPVSQRHFMNTSKKSGSDPSI